MKLLELQNAAITAEKVELPEQPPAGESVGGAEVVAEVQQSPDTDPSDRLLDPDERPIGGDNSNRNVENNPVVAKIATETAGKAFDAFSEIADAILGPAPQTPTERRKQMVQEAHSALTNEQSVEATTSFLNKWAPSYKGRDFEGIASQMMERNSVLKNVHDLAALHDASEVGIGTPHAGAFARLSELRDASLHRKLTEPEHAEAKSLDASFAKAVTNPEELSARTVRSLYGMLTGPGRNIFSETLKAAENRLDADGLSYERPPVDPSRVRILEAALKNGDDAAIQTHDRQLVARLRVEGIGAPNFAYLRTVVDRLSGHPELESFSVATQLLAKLEANAANNTDKLTGNSRVETLRKNATKSPKAVAAVETKPAAPFNQVPVEAVRIPGLDADIVLPVGPKQGAGNAFSEYVDRIKHHNIFPDSGKALTKLGKVTATPAAPAKEGQPTIAIMTNRIEQLDGDHFIIKRVVPYLNELGYRVQIVPPAADVNVDEQLSAEQRSDVWRSMAQGFDGVLGFGGDDIHPFISRRPTNFATGLNYRRDRFEAEFLETVLPNQDAFFFAICRSHQMYQQVGRGGKETRGSGYLTQDVNEAGVSVRSMMQGGMGNPVGELYQNEEFAHLVHVNPDSELAAIAGDDAEFVSNSHRHQVVDQEGAGFDVSAVYRDPDTGADQIMATEAWNIITTQWHPEFLYTTENAHNKVFSALIRRSAIFRMAKDLRAEGTEVSAESLSERMRSQPEGAFDVSDYDWVSSQLIPNLKTRWQLG